SDITQLHEHVVRNFVLAKTVFMSRDVEMARRLHAGKTEFGNLERQCAERHLARLKSGKLESIESSAIHLDILRALTRLNSHITTVRCSSLEDAGQLFRSRLKAAD